MTNLNITIADEFASFSYPAFSLPGFFVLSLVALFIEEYKHTAQDTAYSHFHVLKNPF